VILGTLKNIKDFDTVLDILHPRFRSKDYLVNFIRQIFPYEIPRSLLNADETTLEKLIYLIGLLIANLWKILKDNVSDDVLYSPSTSVEKLKHIFDLIFRRSYNAFKTIRNNINNFSLTLLELRQIAITFGVRGYSALNKQNLIKLIISFLDEYGLGLK
jgi:hypothetical protein